MISKKSKRKFLYASVIVKIDKVMVRAVLHMRDISPNTHSHVICKMISDLIGFRTRWVSYDSVCLEDIQATNEYIDEIEETLNAAIKGDIRPFVKWHDQYHDDNNDHDVRVWRNRLVRLRNALWNVVSYQGKDREREMKDVFETLDRRIATRHVSIYGFKDEFKEIAPKCAEIVESAFHGDRTVPFGRYIRAAYMLERFLTQYDLEDLMPDHSDQTQDPPHATSKLSQGK